MVQAWKLLTLTGLLAGGCFGKPFDQRLVRAQLGVNSRQVVMDDPSSKPSVTIARATVPEEVPSAPLETAVTGALQFSVRYLEHLYLGGEVEAGAFARTGSNYGGAYGVIGAEAGATRAWLSLELVAGRQWLRYDLDAVDIGRTVLEPRVRAQLLINPQISLGGMIGANAMPEERGWTAGFYIGIYSHPVDGSQGSDR